MTNPQDDATTSPAEVGGGCREAHRQARVPSAYDNKL